MSTDTFTRCTIVGDAGVPRPDRPRARMTPQAGLTLVEMVMFILVISVGLVGVLSVMNFTTRSSADPMIREQALLIAESYVEEIVLKAFLDPSTPPVTQVCPTTSPYKEASRSAYDNICDYNGLSDTGARDQFGNAIPGLESYNVAVTVSGGSTLSVGPAANPVNNTGAIRVLQVDVTVTNGNVPGFSLPLTAYRLNYNCSNAGDAGCQPL